MKFSNSRNNNNNRPFKRSNNYHRRQGEPSNSGPKISGNLTTVLEKYKNLAKDATSSGDYVTAENYLQHAEHYVRLLNERNARNNSESKTQATNASQTENKDTSSEKLKVSVSDEPVDIIKVLKPIPMEDNSDGEDGPDVKKASDVKKKAIKKTGTSKK